MTAPNFVAPNFVLNDPNQPAPYQEDLSKPMIEVKTPVFGTVMLVASLAAVVGIGYLLLRKKK